MKNLFRFFLICILFFLSKQDSKAQGINCSSSDPFCTGTTYTFPNNTNDPSLGAINCCTTTPNPAWYFMELDQSGNMTIQINQVDGSGSGIDVDFVLFGPYANLTAACASIPGGPVEDCSYSTAAVEYADITGGIVGETYVLLLTNYANDPGTITFNQTGGAGSADCSILCGVNSFTAVPSACNSSNNTYSVSGTINITNPPATGTATFTSSCGGTPVVVNAPFAANINYNITGLTSNGANCTVSVVFSADGTCNTSVNYTAPGPCLPCSMDAISLNIGACNSSTDQYGITGTLSFSNPPATGTLTIQTCGGQTQVISAPFTSPVAINITGIPADATANCTVTATFSASPSCTITSTPFNEPASCTCPVNVGNFTSSMVGNGTNPIALCEGDQVLITSTGGTVNPLNVGTLSGNAFAPGLGYLIYSCPPTVGLDPLSDPCYEGVFNTTSNLSDINDLSVINSYPVGTFTNNTVYYVPIMFYNQAAGFYDPSCWDLGSAVTVTYLNPIVSTIVESCLIGTATITVSGGYPEFFGGNFTASNLSPASASFANTTCPNGGTIVINGLQDGDVYSFTIVDANGCPHTVNGGPFDGPTDPIITAAGPFCQNDAAQQLVSTPLGGTWSGNGVNASSGMFDPTTAGVGSHTILYTASGCSLTDTIVIVVNASPNANAGNDVVICEGENTQLSASGGQTYSWSPATGLSDPLIANPIADPINTTTYTVTVTSANGCTSTDQVTVTVSSVVASISANPTSGNPPLTVNFTNNTIGANNFSWDYGDTTFQVTTSTSTSNIYDNYGTYQVVMVASNADGCTDTASLTILVVQPFSILIPNVISPNSDGANDVFDIIYTGVKTFTIQIYDRWGVLMADLDGLTVKWDGTKDNKVVSDGTYFYIINIVDVMDGSHIYNGTLTVYTK